jgi:hypothetical protein
MGQSFAIRQAWPNLMGKAFEKWKELMTRNALAKIKGDPPTGYIFPFHDDRTSSIRVG